MADEGASPRELLFEACRRDNTDLLHDLLRSFKSPNELSRFINTAKDGLGSGALHIAAQYGSHAVLDMLLDQEGVEIDLKDVREGDTCLHKGVRYVNSLSTKEKPEGLPIVDILLDAGCDPRIRNKAKLRPFDLADPSYKDLRTVLQKAEYAFAAGDDVVRDDDDDAGPASDSD